MKAGTMKVGMYYNNSDVRLEEQPVPTVGDGELLIKVEACAICGSDLLEWYRIKRAPLVLGHELTGEIVEVGEGVESHRPGDRVFTTHHVPCDECYYCLTGHHTACKTFQEKNNFAPGGFAQYLKVGGRSVKTGTLKLPEEISAEAGTFIEPLGTVVRAFRTLEIEPGESVMIIGAGLIGIMFIKVARALGIGNIFASDIDDYRLEWARRVGADFVAPANRPLPDFVRGHNGSLADKVILCTGALSAAESAIECVDKGGTVLFFAVPTPGEKLAIDFNPYWRDDIGFKTCYGAAPLDNVQAMELLRTGAVTVEDMITHRFGIDEIGRAFGTAATPHGALKVIVKPNG